MNQKDLKKLKNRYAFEVSRDCYDNWTNEEALRKLTPFDAIEIYCVDKNICGRWTKEFLLVRMNQDLNGLEMFERFTKEMSIMKEWMSGIKEKLDSPEQIKVIKDMYYGQGVNLFWMCGMMTFGYLRNLSDMSIEFSPLAILKHADMEHYDACVEIRYHRTDISKSHVSDCFVKLGGGKTAESCLANAKKHVDRLLDDLPLIEEYAFDWLLNYKDGK